MCVTLSNIKASVPYASTNWDASRIQACQCDAGFFGTDCSQRMCPTGDDPLTICPTTNMGGQVQSIKVTLGSRLNRGPGATPGAPVAGDAGMDLFGTSDTMSLAAVAASADLVQLHVGSTDAFNSRRGSRTAAKAALSFDSTGEASLKVALENTPGVGAVAVTGAYSLNPYGASYSILEKTYQVTFVPDYVSSINVGRQNLLTCDSGYGCTGAGCAPLVRMPFLYRYAALGAPLAALSAAPNSVNFYTGAFNTAADFNAGKFVRLHPDSSPRLPVGSAPDASLASPTDNTGTRYDARLLIAVQDPTSPAGDNAVDVFWTRVVYGNANIGSDAFEYVAGSGAAGPWDSSSGKMNSYSPSLLGFTYQGFIPSSLRAVLPEAPGMILQFPSTNMVASDGYYTFFEVLVKLPSCAVAVVQDVDARVENVECSNRGQCDRSTGLCQCYTGYYGTSCSRQTTMVRGMALPPSKQRPFFAHSLAHPPPPLVPPFSLGSRCKPSAQAGGFCVCFFVWAWKKKKSRGMYRVERAFGGASEGKPSSWNTFFVGERAEQSSWEKKRKRFCADS